MITTINDKAKKINALHTEATLTARKAMQTIIDAGILLNEVKAELKHGEFNSWCEANLKLSRTTIFRYMTIAENKDKIKEAETPSEAMKLITKCSNLKHLKDGIYLKVVFNSVVIVYVKNGYIGYIQHMGDSYSSLRSIREAEYINEAKSMRNPIPDNTYLFIEATEDCELFKELFSHVPNEWFIINGWLSKHIVLIEAKAPIEYHFWRDWTPIN